MKLRVLSLNMLAPCFTTDPDTNELWDYLVMPIKIDLTRRASTLAKVIRRSAADIVLCQEVEAFDFTAFEGDYHVLHARHRAGYWSSVEEHGVAILIRKKATLLSSTAVELSSDGNTALIARFEIEGRAVVVGCLHLECTDDMRDMLDANSEGARLRAEQIRSLVAELKSVCQHDDTLCIIGGDFNAPAVTFPDLLGLGFQSPMLTWAQRTYFDGSVAVCDHPHHCIDMIGIMNTALGLQSKGVSIRLQPDVLPRPPRGLSAEELLKECVNLYGTDHLPVMVSVMIP